MIICNCGEPYDAEMPECPRCGEPNAAELLRTAGQLLRLCGGRGAATEMIVIADEIKMQLRKERRSSLNDV